MTWDDHAYCDLGSNSCGKHSVTCYCLHIYGDVEAKKAKIVVAGFRPEDICWTPDEHES